MGVEELSVPYPIPMRTLYAGIQTLLFTECITPEYHNGDNCEICHRIRAGHDWIVLDTEGEVIECSRVYATYRMAKSSVTVATTVLFEQFRDSDMPNAVWEFTLSGWNPREVWMRPAVQSKLRFWNNNSEFPDWNDDMVVRWIPWEAAE